MSAQSVPGSWQPSLVPYKVGTATSPGPEEETEAQRHGVVSLSQLASGLPGFRPTEFCHYLVIYYKSYRVEMGHAALGSR